MRESGAIFDKEESAAEAEERLRERLGAAWGSDVRENNDVFAILGKAKWHVYTPGKKWGGKMRGRPVLAGQQDSEAQTGR